MPKANKAKRSGQKAPAKPKKTGVKRSTIRSSVNAGHGSYVDMITDPCNSVLRPGIFGDAGQMLARLKRDHVNQSGNATCGFVLWVPQYSGGNIVFGFGTDPAASPLNTAAVPYGSGTGAYTATTGSAKFLTDPCYSFVSGDTCQDFRLVSACLRMTYLGTMANTSGQVAFLDNVPLNSMLVGGAGATTPSVNDLYQYQTQSRRFSLDTMEHKFAHYAPNLSANFHDEGDVPLILGVGVPSSVSALAAQEAPIAFGYAWRGASGLDVSSLAFEFISNIEWRSEPTSGIVAQPLRVLSPSLMQTAIAMADARAPGWRTTAMKVAESGAMSLAKLAWAGAKRYSPVVSGLASSFQALTMRGNPLMLTN